MSHGVDYLQFSFRWMNNLLTRELPLYCTIRLWDTYLAESDGFAVFQLYVCAAFLLHWREQLLQETDFQVRPENILGKFPINLFMLSPGLDASSPKSTDA
jgi:Rab-GTPase-TBC domain